MDRINSATPGVVSAKQTPVATESGATQAKVKDGQVTATTANGPFAGGPATAGASDIPQPLAGGTDSAYGEEALNKAFDAQTKLEKELDSIDPTTPEGSKKLMQIQRKLQRVDEVIRIINEIRKARHDTNMSIIDNMA